MLKRGCVTDEIGGDGSCSGLVAYEVTLGASRLVKPQCLVATGAAYESEQPGAEHVMEVNEVTLAPGFGADGVDGSGEGAVVAEGVASEVKPDYFKIGGGIDKHACHTPLGHQGEAVAWVGSGESVEDGDGHSHVADG